MKSGYEKPNHGIISTEAWLQECSFYGVHRSFTMNHSIDALFLEKPLLQESSLGRFFGVSFIIRTERVQFED